jgi:hypothetical protein
LRSTRLASLEEEVEGGEGELQGTPTERGAASIVAEGDGLRARVSGSTRGGENRGGREQDGEGEERLGKEGFGGVLIRSRAVAGGGNGELGGADTQQLVSQRRRQSNFAKRPSVFFWVFLEL